jgi:hypothetical protein
MVLTFFFGEIYADFTEFVRRRQAFHRNLK